MPFINAFDTAPGRSVEVYCGDLFDESINIDLLVISAWENYYEPDPGSMVAVLRDSCGIEVGKLPRALDLTSAPSIKGWVSPPLNTLPDAPRWPAQKLTRFTRIAVVESPRNPRPETTENKVFQQLFCLLALLPLHEIDCPRVATPLLNTGRQKAKPESLYPAMLKAIGNGFRFAPELRKLVIFDLKRDALEHLCSEIDAKLNRSVLQRERLRFDKEDKRRLTELRGSLQTFHERHHHLAGNSEVNGYLTTIERQLGDADVTLVTLAITARKLLEALVSERLGGRGRGLSLYEQIRLLSQDVSAWSTSAMHTVRTFGNWMGHASLDIESDPLPRREVQRDDMLLMLYSLQRVLNDYPWPIAPTSRRYLKRHQRDKSQQHRR